MKGGTKLFFPAVITHWVSKTSSKVLAGLYLAIIQIRAKILPSCNAPTLDFKYRVGRENQIYL